MRFVPVLALLALATPALAHQDADGAADKKAASEKKICRAVVATGSIMSKRECHTKAEWDAMSDRSTNARTKLDRDMGGRTGGLGITPGGN
ncbi:MULTISPECIES: hypothetical protein [unclassified Sphingomonas]|jgi:hypothetical protein|uniref:hypothetical protein n=1 Tax=unclassified Sphingomonas TaxID=196159 RepID=UPI000AF7CAA3|nr:MULTISPECIES: hypothetical protein [unclassified Sphingomonas]